ncbi:MAG: chromosome partitioning protein ParA, partial [Alistipes sp.]|nr:chromosome partitioning protein ParA [Alistipes sp.]
MSHPKADRRKFSTQDIVRLILPNWYWYLVSLILFVGGALVYLKITPPEYMRTATLLVKDSRKGSGWEVTAFSDIVGSTGHHSVDNELHIIKSRRLMESVVERYDLTTEYTVKHGLRTIDLYGQSPMLVEFIEPDNEATGRFKCRVRKDGGVEVYDFDNDATFSAIAAPGDTIATPLGNIVLKATPYADEHRELTVTKRSLNDMVEEYRSRLKCDIANKQASVINITITDEVPRRAEDIINGIVEAYNLDAITDKREVSRLTKQFITERLITLGTELNMADEEVANYKTSNHLYSPADEATLGIKEAQELRNS